MIHLIVLLNFILREAFTYDLAQLIYKDSCEHIVNDLEDIKLTFANSNLEGREIRFETKNKSLARAIRLFYSQNSFKEKIIFKEKKQNNLSSTNNNNENDQEIITFTFSLKLKNGSVFRNFSLLFSKKIEELYLEDEDKIDASHDRELNLATHKEDSESQTKCFLENIEKLDDESKRITQFIFSEGISKLERICKNFYIELLFDLEVFVTITEIDTKIVIEFNKFTAGLRRLLLRSLISGFMLTKFNVISPEIEITIDRMINSNQKIRKIIIPKDLYYSLSIDFSHLKENTAENRNLSLKDYFLKIQKELSFIDEEGESFLKFRKTIRKIFSSKTDKEDLKNFFIEEKIKKGNIFNVIEDKFLNKENKKSNFNNIKNVMENLKAERGIKFLQWDASENDDGFEVVEQVEDDIIINSENSTNLRLKVERENKRQNKKGKRSEKVKKKKGLIESMGTTEKVVLVLLVIILLIILSYIYYKERIDKEEVVSSEENK